MSQNRGPFALFVQKFELLQKCNNRAERSLTKVGTIYDNDDLHQKLETDRQQALKLCLECKELLTACPNTPQRTQYTNELKVEMERFETLSKELQAKDVAMNQKAAQNKPTQQSTGSSQQQKKQQKNNQQQGYDLLLQDDDEDELLFQQQQQQQEVAKQSLLSEEQMQTINIEQMQRRRDEIKQIEADVLTVATMFQDLQQLVYEQGEQLDVIEEHTLQTQQNTENAYVELETAEEHQIASARSLKYLMCAGVVALIAVVVVAIVLYTKKKKNPE